MKVLKISVKLICALLLLCFMKVVFAQSPILDEQRKLFQTWQTTFKSLNKDAQQKLLLQLKDYPLYVYAQYDYLSANFNTISSQEINQFVKANPQFLYTSKLVQAYLEYLTQKSLWSTIVKLNIDNSLASRCMYQYAWFKQGDNARAFKSVNNMWLSGADLSSKCEPLFEAWSNAGEKSANLILLRIELVLGNNNIKLARYLTEQLPDNYKTLKTNLLALYDNPQKLADFAKNIYPSPFSKKIIMLSFSRLASLDTEQAKTLLPTLVKQQKLTPQLEQTLLKSIALNYFKDTTTEQQRKWRDDFIVKNKDVTLIERRIRQEIKDNNIANIGYWLNLLPKTDQQKDEWQYWHAMVLLSEKKTLQAQQILNNLAKGRGFYAIYSAQQLGIPYQLDLAYTVIGDSSWPMEKATLEAKYNNNITIKRINELRFWGMLALASQEWRNYLYGDINNRHYAELARYAYYQDWGEHSVQATIAGKLWENWVERFPVVYVDVFNESLAKKNISLSYALAIARQESALEPTVESPAGARGLMQIMPGTAKDSAKKVASVDYQSPNQLYEPVVNIQLGTYYLDYVYQRFDNNRILAAAAYNAGPTRVSRWLQETNNQLDVIAFIESIPFTETRNYVKSVLVYDYIYQLILQDQPQGIINSFEVARKY